MPRAAGNSTHYADEIWRPNYAGPITAFTEVVRPLPSVTHIIKSTVANPTLVGWAYRQTRDVIAGMIAFIKDDVNAYQPEDGYSMLELLSDGDVLEEWLKENKLTLRDITKMHQDRGTREHFHMEELTKRPTRDAQLRLAERYLKSTNGWRRGIGEWWLKNEPKVIASERVLPHPNAGYCGSVDLVWEDRVGAVVITDLKTRLDEREAYDSDEFQVDAYGLAWAANYGYLPDARSVLVAMPNESPIDHYDFTIEQGAFLAVLNLYNARKGVPAEELS